MIKLKNLLLEKITKGGIDVHAVKTPEEKEQFRFFIEDVHYLHKLPGNINTRMGAFYKGVMVGAIAYGSSTRTEIAQDLGGNFSSKEDIRELRRLVVARESDIVELKKRLGEVPKWYYNAIKGASEVNSLGGQIITGGNEEIKSLIPSLKMVITFADSTQGHHGGVYQASITPGVTGDYFGQGKDKRLHLYIYYLGSQSERQQTRQRLMGTEGKRKPEDEFPKEPGYQYSFKGGKEWRPLHKSKLPPKPETTPSTYQPKPKNTSQLSLWEKK
jgi:hypothetical protein